MGYLSGLHLFLNPAARKSSMMITRATPANGVLEMEGMEMLFSDTSITVPSTSLEADSISSTGFGDAVPTPPDGVLLKLPAASPEEWRLAEELL